MDKLIPATIIFSALILVIPGILIKYKKAYWLLAGYNTMSKDKKKNVDTEGLGKFVGNMCFVLAAIVALAGIAIMAGQTVLAGIISGLIVPVSVYLLIRAQKYDGNTRNSDGTMNTKTKLTLGVVFAFFTITLIGVGMLMNASNKPINVYIADQYLKIEGMYGEKINLQDIDEVILMESLPKIEIRTNGSALGNKLKGHFRLEGMGDVKLFVDKSKLLFIYIGRDTRPVILNFDEDEKTRELFELLVTEWEKARY